MMKNIIFIALMGLVLVSIGCGPVCKGMEEAACSKEKQCKWTAPVPAAEAHGASCVKTACPAMTGVESTDSANCAANGCTYVAATTDASTSATVDATCTDDASLLPPCKLADPATGTSADCPTTSYCVYTEAAGPTGDTDGFCSDVPASK